MAAIDNEAVIVKKKLISYKVMDYESIKDAIKNY